MAERRNGVVKHKDSLSESELNEMLRLQRECEEAGEPVHLNSLIIMEHPDLYIDSKHKPQYWMDPNIDQVLANLLIGAKNGVSR